MSELDLVVVVFFLSSILLFVAAKFQIVSYSIFDSDNNSLLAMSWQAHLNLIEKQSKKESLRTDGEILRQREADTTPLPFTATLAINGLLPTR